MASAGRAARARRASRSIVRVKKARGPITSGTRTRGSPTIASRIHPFQRAPSHGVGKEEVAPAGAGDLMRMMPPRPRLRERERTRGDAIAPITSHAATPWDALAPMHASAEPARAMLFLADSAERGPLVVVPSLGGDSVTGETNPALPHFVPFLGERFAKVSRVQPAIDAWSNELIRGTPRVNLHSGRRRA